MTVLRRGRPRKNALGKDAVLSALSALCMSCHKSISAADPNTPDAILSLILSACSKKTKKYREAAFSCLEQVLKAFNNPDFFNKAFPQLFDMCTLQINTTGQNNLSSDLRGDTQFKLKALKSKLKEWSASTYGNLEKKKELLTRIIEFDCIQQSRPLTEEEVVQKANVVKDFEDFAKREEIAWRQRSRTLWIKQGDKNTKFFQKISNAHKRINHIDKLVVEGQELEEAADIKREIVSFYQKLYSDSENWRPSYNMNHCPSINTEEQQQLPKDLLKRKKSYLGLRLVS
ncbi:hypothetical protein MTR67_048947 [Solanum verrucosum]|uniref:Uncharacterized protein n=1 Tax=Solanum verrucosum TaxID=315347 RepID=A0AAF0ZX00_SOLVR|nr:hypothetical protein MTR67_048947 [Solanum verrucosum]